MPAAAVIPAPIAYINVVAVKKLVVGFLVKTPGRLRKGSLHWLSLSILRLTSSGIYLSVLETPVVYCEQIRVFKARFT